MQTCLLQFQTWAPPWVPCPLLCLWCSQWVLGIEEWCVVYQRETTPYLHHHTLTWRAAISDTFYLVSTLALMDGNRKRSCFKSHLFLSWSRHDWQFCRAVVSLSLSGDCCVIYTPSFSGICFYICVWKELEGVFYLNLTFDYSSCFDFRINRKQSMPGFCLQWLVAWKLLLFFFSCSLKQYLICA